MKIFLLCVLLLFFEVVICTKHMQEDSLHGDMRVLTYNIPENEIGFNILALGDSLTRGLYFEQNRHEHHPYALSLAKSFEDQFTTVAATKNMTVYETGISGEMTSTMVDRLRHYLDELKNLQFVILLGGTNDISREIGADSILKNLLDMHNLVRQISSPEQPVYSVAVTVPPIGQTILAHRAFLERTRKAVNDGLRAFVLANSDRVALLDMDQHFSVADVDGEERNRRGSFWSRDEVHLNAQGYDEMGRLLHRTIVEFHQKKAKAPTGG